MVKRVGLLGKDHIIEKEIDRIIISINHSTCEGDIDVSNITSDSEQMLTKDSQSPTNKLVGKLFKPFIKSFTNWYIRSHLFNKISMI